MEIEGLDKINNEILEVIKDNARLTYSEISEKVGISRISVKKRMDEMEKQGIITGYRTEIDVSKAKDGMEFLVDIETVPDFYEVMLEILSKSRYIRKIYSVSGECAIHAIGIISNHRNMELFVNSLYRNAEKGIRRIKCMVVLSTIMDLDGGIVYERYQEPEHLETGTKEGTIT